MPGGSHGPCKAWFVLFDVGMAKLFCLWILVAAAASCSSAADKTATRVPVSHRPASSACPQERAAGISASDIPAGCSQNPQFVGNCTADSDCTAGANGRCLQVPPFACDYACSYDQCTFDSDCAGTAACACRASGSNTTANTCATASNCRVDADCGPQGSCSPSLLNTFCVACTTENLCGPDGARFLCEADCGSGYFCHTSKDSCVDDSDCPSGTCNFDTTAHSWLCSSCNAPS